MKKILLTGVHGQVGFALQEALKGYHQVIPVTREQLDLTNQDAIRRVIQEVKPDVIVNPAAYTAVDKAESEQTQAFAINADAPKVIAEEAAKIGASLIHLSTDYVYDGNKPSPYFETDAVNPISVYGKSKLAGEEAIRAVGLPHLILRTSWVYGAHGKNFLKTILKLAAEREHLKIVADQYGAPTSSDSIANGIKHLLDVWNPQEDLQTGVYHFTNNGSASWHRFACQIVMDYSEIIGSLGVSLKANIGQIGAISTAEYPTPAARPSNSRLDSAKLKTTFNYELPEWKVALKQVMHKYPTFS